MANTIVQSSIPVSSANAGTTAAISTTIGTTAFVGRSLYLTGFAYQSSGATAGATVTITASYAPVSGTAITLGTWAYIVGTGTTAQSPMDVNLIPPFQSSVPITGLTNATTTTAVGSITLTASGAGAGATGASISAWGYAL